MRVLNEDSILVSFINLLDIVELMLGLWQYICQNNMVKTTKPPREFLSIILITTKLKSDWIKACQSQ